MDIDIDGMAVCQHYEPRRLFLARADGRQAIVHLTTAEVKLLPGTEAGDEWRLNYDDAGFAYMSSPGRDSEWVDEMFDHNLVHDGDPDGEEGALFVQTKDLNGEYMTMPLKSFEVSCRANLEFEIELEHVGAISLKCMALRCGKHGFHVIWNLLHLYYAMNLKTQGKAGKWAAHGWARWCKYLGSLGLGNAHYVNKSECADDMRLGQVMMEMGTDLEWRGISSVSLVALLVRWGYGGTVQLRCDDDKKKAQLVLRSFLAVWFPGKCKWTLWVTYSPRWVPPHVPEGCEAERFVDVEIIQAVLVLGPLFAACPPEYTNVRILLGPHTFGHDRRIDITKALALMWEKQWEPGVYAFFVQLIWFVGRRGDEQSMDSLSLMGDRSMSSMSEREAAQAIAKYGMAAQEAFHKKNIVHIALDASTVGKKSVTFSAMVGRAFISNATIARHRGDTPEAAQQEVRAGWQPRAQQWLTKRALDQVDGPAKTQGKLKRKKAYQWGCTLNQIVEHNTGLSLQDFRVPKPDSDTSPYDWPFMGVSCDQGSDGMSCSFFMRWSEPLCVDFFWDPSHTTWRDQESAVKIAGLRSFAYLMCAVYNMQHSPWDSQARFWQMRESTDEYLEHIAANCPLLEHYLPEILKDWGADQPINQEVTEWAIRRLGEQWQTHHIGLGVKMCRFANFVDKAAEFDKCFHWTLLRVLYLGLTEEIFSCESLANAARSLRLQGGGDNENERAEAWRNANKSTVQLAGQLLSDPMTQSLTRLLERVVCPIREAYGKMSKSLRSSGSMLQWMKEQCVDGELWVPLRETLALLQDRGAMEHIKLEIIITEAEKRAGQDDPRVATNNELAGTMAKYAFALVRARANRLLYLWVGWTGQQSLFLAASEEVREEASRRLLQQSDAFEALTEQTGFFWTKLRERSIFNTGVVQQLVAMLRTSGGEVDARMQDVIKQRLSGIGQSKICEDMVNQVRRLETPASNKQQLPARKMWQHLVDTKVASSIHSFAEPEWQHLVPPTSGASRLNPSDFEVKFRKAPKFMAKIVSHKDSTSWFTSTPMGMSVVFADMAVMTYAHEHGKYNELSKGAGFSKLAGEALLLQAPGETDWYFSMGDVGGIATLVWPATVVFHNRIAKYATPKLDGKCELRVIFSNEWKAMSYEWLSPWGVVVQGLKSIEDVAAAPGLVAHIVEQPCTLLRQAALQGFWDFGVGALGWVGRLAGIRLQAGSSLFTKLDALVRGICTDLDDDKIMDILRKRLKVNSILDELVLDDDACDLIDEQDKKEFQGVVKGMQEEKVNTAKFRDEWCERKREHVAKKSNSGGKKQKRKPYKNAEGKVIKDRAYPESEIGLDVAKELCPYPVRIYEDCTNARWQVFWPGLGSRSRAWHLHGHKDACRQVLAWAWSERLAADGMSKAECPIRGLLADAGPSVPAIASAGSASSAGVGAAASSEQ